MGGYEQMLTEMVMGFFTDKTVIFITVLSFLFFGCIIETVRLSVILSNKVKRNKSL